MHQLRSNVAAGRRPVRDLPSCIRGPAAVVFALRYPYTGLSQQGTIMARAPNYSQERKDRDRVKAAKKAEKQAAKAAKQRTTPSDQPSDQSKSQSEE